MIPTIQTPDEWLYDLRKPSLETVGQLELVSEDWLIVCAGFEDRALAVLENAVSTQTSFNILLILYEPYVEDNKAKTIRNICKKTKIKIEEVIYNRQEPSGFGDILLGHLSACRGRIFIDVSAMSRLLIVQSIVTLGSRPMGFRNCFVIYTEAKKYPPDKNQVEEKLKIAESDPTFSIFFLSSGIFEVTIVPELSSFAPSGAQTRLITFPSLDEHRLTALRNEIQPSRYSFIEGKPPNSQNEWRQFVIAKLNHLDQFPNSEKLETSTLDYRETLDCLLKLYAKYSFRERLLVSPIGSKMQTVAVGIFRTFVEDVQIIYPTPESFIKPTEYTVGIGPIHLLSLEAFHLPRLEC